MTAVFYVNDPLFIEGRFYIVIPLCNERKGGKHVDTRNRFCCLLYPYDLICDLIAYFNIQSVLQRDKLVLRAEDQILKLL